MAKYKDNSDKVMNEIERLTKERLNTAALMVERTAKQMSPVKTGTLRRSITHITQKNKAVVGSNLEYAPHVEMGTVRQSAQPYLRPALMANLSRIKRLFGGK